MSLNPTSQTAEPPSPRERAGFAWPGAVRDEAELLWREMASETMTWLFRDGIDHAIYRTTREQINAVQRLTYALTIQDPKGQVDRTGLHADEIEWRNRWLHARSNSSDRRYVISFLGERIARQESDHHGPTLMGARMGSAHGTDWLGRMAVLGWQGVGVPLWLDQGAARMLRGSRDSHEINLDTQEAFHPWSGPNGSGLQDDLEVFLTAFCTTHRAGDHTDEPLWIPGLSKKLILLRALSVVSDKILPSTLPLIDEAESSLNINALNNENNGDCGGYAVVRAAADREMLERVGVDVELSPTSPNGARHRSL